MKRNFHSWQLDGIAVVLLFCAGLRLTWQLSQGLDIGLYDESLYLYGGATLGDVGLPDSNWNPFYLVWYWFLSCLQSDRMSLYYLNYALMTVLPPLVGYLALRVYQIPRVIGLLLSWFLLVSAINIPTWPKVSHFALLLIFLTIIAARYCYSWRTKALCISLGALCTTYVRPEYFLVFLLSASIFLIASFIALYFGDRHNKKVIYQLFFYLVIVSALSIFFGLPLGSDRTIIAFGQHFSYNWAVWNQSDSNFWIDWEYIVVQNFGEIDGFGDAFRSNPSLVIKHVIYNAWGLTANITEKIFPLFLPVSKLSKILILTLLIHFSYTKRKILCKDIKDNHKLLSLLSLFLLPGFISTLLIFPREHYIFVIVGLLWFILSLLFARYWSRQTSSASNFHPLKSLVSVGILLIALTPNYIQLIDVQQANLPIIHYIQSLNISSPVNLLDAAGGFSIYAGENFQYVPHSLKDNDFEDFVEAQEINFIAVTDTLRDARKFKEDEQWLNFLNNYEDYGYVKRIVPNTEIVLLIESSLLNPS